MTPQQLANKIDKTGHSRRRAAHGQWVAPAEAVYELVTNKQWNVSDAVREVVKSYKFPNEDGKAFNGIRAAFYVLRNKKDSGFEI